MSALRYSNPFKALFLLALLPVLSHAAWVHTMDSTTNDITALFDAGPFLIAGAEARAFRSSDNRAAWTLSQSGLFYDQAEGFAKLGDDIFMATYSHGVLRSSDNGAQWAEANTDMGRIQINTLAVMGKLLFAGSYRGVFRSADSGKTWRQPEELGDGKFVAQIEGLVVSGTRLIAATRLSGLYSSADSGQSWTQVQEGTFSVLGGDGATLLAGNFDRRLFLSQDSGRSWTELDTVFQAATFDAIAVRGANLFVGTSQGLFRISRDGSSIVSVEEGWPYYGSINALVLRGDFLYAAIGGGSNAAGYCNGVWRIPLAELGAPVSLAKGKSAGWEVPTAPGSGTRYDAGGRIRPARMRDHKSRPLFTRP